MSKKQNKQINIVYQLTKNELGGYNVAGINWQKIYTNGRDKAEAKRMAQELTETFLDMYLNGELHPEEHPDFNANPGFSKNRFQLTFDPVTGKHIPTNKAEA